MKFISVLKGIIVGVITSIVIPIVNIGVLSRFAGGSPNYFSNSWSYIASFMTVVPVAAFIGLYFTNKKSLTNKQRWVISSIVVLLIGIFINTVGITIGYFIVQGSLEKVNIISELPFRFLTVALSLPISIPLGKLIIDILYRWINKIPLEN